MNTQSVRLPIIVGGVLITNRSQAISALDQAKQDQQLLIERLFFAIGFYSGGACLHPVQPSDVLVQGGN